jgi:hypothetical protein
MEVEGTVVSDKEKMVDAINNFFGCDAAYFDVNPFDLADHLIARGVRLEEKQATSDGWIPVTERLPEDGQDVLGFLQNDTERRIFPANYDHGIWFDCLFNIHIQSVTHWMPLPEPPKGE